MTRHLTSIFVEPVIPVSHGRLEGLRSARVTPVLLRVAINRVTCLATDDVALTVAPKLRNVRGVVLAGDQGDLTS